MTKPHVLAIPYPAQGHVIPALELAQLQVKQGVKVTFVNTDFIHKQVMNALCAEDRFGDQVDMVSIPDGLEPWEDRSDLGKLSESTFRVMPCKLEGLIEKIDGSSNDKITCAVTDVYMGWAINVAEKRGLKRAAFWCASAASLAVDFSYQKQIDDGIVDESESYFAKSFISGILMKNQLIRLSPTMPAIKSTSLLRLSIGDLATQNIVFGFTIKIVEAAKAADWVICNTTSELEPEPLGLIPNILPVVGPLLASNRLAKQSGNFWQEDSTCLAWLDKQPARSVIYVAFGSFTVLDQTQFQELALGLELTNRPFLWVVRPGLTDEIKEPYPKGFKDRIGSRGRMVGWAPQQKILSHPSVACFMTHCGWNSILEGLSNGIPFLCWSYFADQLLNETYICEIWKNGLGFEKDESGIIRQGEFNNKVEELLDNKIFRERAMDLQERVLSKFIDWIKERDN